MDKLVGLDYSEVNCWQLAQKFYKDILGIELKHRFDYRLDDSEYHKSLIYSSIGDFDKVESPKYGDLILIKVRGVESHIAVYLDNGLMLHTAKATGSVVDRISRWDKVIVGFYRATEKAINND